MTRGGLTGEVSVYALVIAVVTFVYPPSSPSPGPPAPPPPGPWSDAVEVIKTVAANFPTWGPPLAFAILIGIAYGCGRRL